MALPVRSVISGSIFLGDCCHARLYSFAAPSVLYRRTQYKASTTKMASANAQGRPKTIDSHLHIWASPQEAADKYPYFPGQEPTLPGHLDFLLQCMEEASVEGALIVQPINHKFDHSLVTSVLKKHPTKFVGCCLANPAENGIGVKQLEDLILKDGYRAVRFNPYLWPSGQQMTNEVGKAMFSRAGELGVPVGFMCMKGLNLHISEITELCTEFPSTAVLLDHLAFCKPPLNDEEKLAFSELLKLSRFPQQFWHHEDAMAIAKIFESKQWWREHQISSISKNMTLIFLGIEQWSLQLKALHSSIDHKVYVKFSALFRVSRMSSPYLDLVPLLAEVVSNFGANRVMWGSDFPYVVPENGYKGAKEAACLIASQASLSSSEVEWIMGKTVMQLFQGQWLP